MPFRRVPISTRAPSLGSPLAAALRPIEATTPHTVQLALDTMIAGPRVIAELGLQGASAFTVPADDDPTYSPGPRIYPDAETPRVALRLDGVELTPGHVLELQVLALPSGPTQYDQGTQDWTTDGRGGSVEMLVVYSNDEPATVAATAVCTPSASTQVHGAEPPGAHDALEVLSDVARPWALLPSAADLERWSARRVTAAIEIRYIGSVRPVDVAVIERPAQSLVMDHASAEWPSNGYTDAGQPYAVPPSSYPITQLSGTDPSGGLEAIRRALEGHGARLGPCLAWWSSAQESSGTILDWVSYDGGTGDDEAPPWTTSSTTPVQLGTGGPIALVDELPGWLLGGYARRSGASDEWLDGRTGVLPVWWVVYARCTDGVVQLRAGSGEWSTVDCAVTSGVWEGQIVPGWVEVGVGPEDGPIGRGFAWSPSGVDVDVRYAAAFYRHDRPA